MEFNSTSHISYHPYYPLGIQLPEYVANEWSVMTLVTTFIGGWGVMLGLTYAFMGIAAPKLKTADKIAALWFVLSRSCPNISVLCESMLIRKIYTGSWKHSSFL